MAYLKTVLTYHLPSEAEVDKAFLESHGLTVCLLNGNTTRNELGAAFFIQLQVADEEHAEAVRLLREANPGRFGSASVVNALDRAIKRTVGLFLLGAFFAATSAVLLMPAPRLRPDRPYYEQREPDLRPLAGFLAGIFGGYLAVRIGRKLDGPPKAAPPSPDSAGTPHL